MRFIVPERKKDYGYVGFDVEKDNSQFVFPCQFVGNIDEFDEREKRKSARQILKLIKKAKEDLNHSGSNEELFQFNSMIWLIQNFIERGYYFEHETVVKANVSGKINWKKTIKNNSIWFDDGNIVYNKIFSNVKQIDDDAIISEIYKFCLSVAIKNLGFVFGIEKTDESSYGLKDLDFMVYYLKKRNNSTFLDYKKLLFGHMLNILLEGKIEKEETSIFANDREFEYVFELMIDKVFGIGNKKRFNPTARYVFEDKKVFNVSALRPDTIFEYENEDGQKFCWVIDAKYYSFNYGEKSSNGLPAQSSINKQFIYQKFIEETVYSSDSQIKVGSVFILPFCAKENESKIQYMNGYAEARWNNEIEGKVYLFKVDLKTLFDDFYNNNDKLRLEFIKELKTLKK